MYTDEIVRQNASPRKNQIRPQIPSHRNLSRLQRNPSKHPRHPPQMDIPPTKDIVVLGGSFTGIQLVRRLQESVPMGFRVTFIERNLISITYPISRDTLL
ncbi:hypothetical protein DPV78_009248 [Talaromyces pinophilus]|nr:hypothetical protein DPV78_009248 [Talaromyces pinophilus]